MSGSIIEGVGGSFGKIICEKVCLRISEVIQDRLLRQRANIISFFRSNRFSGKILNK